MNVTRLPSSCGISRNPYQSFQEGKTVRTCASVQLAAGAATLAEGEESFPPYPPRKRGKGCERQ